MSNITGMIIHATTLPTLIRQVEAVIGPVRTTRVRDWMALVPTVGPPILVIGCGDQLVSILDIPAGDR